MRASGYVERAHGPQIGVDFCDAIEAAIARARVRQETL
jgi:hypothetical protein